MYEQNKKDPVILKGKGKYFSKNIAAAIKRAKPGDRYTFSDIKVKCPGETISRTVSNLTLRIK